MTILECRLAERSACSVVERLLRWRSAADVSVMRSIAGGRLGAWSRRRVGRPRGRWEDLRVKAAGESWLAEIPARRRQLIDKLCRILLPGMSHAAAHYTGVS